MNGYQANLNMKFYAQLNKYLIQAIFIVRNEYKNLIFINYVKPFHKFKQVETADLFRNP